MRGGRHSRMLGLVIAGALGFGLAVGCGSDRPPAEIDNVTTPASGRGGTTSIVTDAGTDQPPGCGTQSDGTSCGCVDVPLYDDPPTLYFVLDRSGSMAEDDKWTQVREAAASIMRNLGPRANFGATVFPGNADQCSAGVEVLPVTNGDPPSASADGPATKALINATAYPPGGGTPTAATLAAVHQRLLGVSGKIYVVLATDGGPNCNLTTQCSVDQCQVNIDSSEQGCTPSSANCCTGTSVGNCNDGDATVSAITALKGSNIATYVVGLPGTGGPYATLLDAMATAGGTALPTSPRYFAVDSTSLVPALRKIAAQITGTCTYQLKSAPKDPGLVNVYLDNLVLPQEPVNGWTISGTTVTLVGSACQNVKDGNILDVRIITGCPTVLPK